MANGVDKRQTHVNNASNERLETTFQNLHRDSPDDVFIPKTGHGGGLIEAKKPSIITGGGIEFSSKSSSQASSQAGTDGD